jgi:LPS sulfotransferase NodH
MTTADRPTPCHGHFILLAVARSGSGLLQDYLNQHESIRCLGEIFKKEFIKKETWQDFKKEFINKETWQDVSGRSAELKHLHQTDLVSFWKLILEKYKLNRPVLGAKIFYSHREGEEIWRYFASSRTPIVHLMREELIDSFLSKKLARAAGIWKQLKNDEVVTEYNRRIFIDLDAFRHYCVKFWRQFDSIKSLFRDNPCLEITYSALVQDREKTMSEIYSFLGLPNEETSPRLVRQLSRPREELIINWNATASFIEDNDHLCVIH